ncbi:MAG: DUF1911 domain-containing protein [Azonexus sp.]|nr:DUF1911 domain-containing protein [Azonexus sp.]
MTAKAIDWKKWKSWKRSVAQLKERREHLMNPENYSRRFDKLVDGLHMVTTDLPQYLDQPEVNGLMASTQQRLWDVMNWLSLQYSAGAEVAQMAEVWPYALDWAEEYAGFSHRFNESPDAYGRVCAHVSLSTESYWIVALRLVCFGLLTGNASQMPRVMAILDYANDEKDGLLERLVSPFMAGRGTPPDKCLRHLPYRKLLKVFAAAPDKRPPLMVKYLEEWYEASRREPYVNQHDSYRFEGYWSWEAAATAWMLDIDDSTFRDMPFYPRDLVDFARALDGAVVGSPSPPSRPNVPANHPCPETGWWFTPAKAGSRRHFTQGSIMPDVEGSAYGATFWQWSPDQSAPTL